MSRHRLLQPRAVAGHPAGLPQDPPHLPVEPVDRVVAVGPQQPPHALAHLRLGRAERLVRRGQDRLPEQRREVVADRHRQDEVAVRQPLHQRAGAEPVRPVVGEVRLADRVQPGDRGHQVVVDPQAAHRVVGRGVDAHRHAVRVVAGDARVHLEEVPVAGADDRLAEPPDRLREVQVDAVVARPDAVAGVDHALGGARGHVARDEVAERRVAALQVVVALVLGDLVRRAVVAGLAPAPRCARRCAATRSSA